ncbi:hypothetical protein C7974DRAFT_8532 [Boeremia exigua]|uniref:uncharacterized protein n=1 Tax=Boeremia exigua TaxID=749465 RepID=UPI001E8CF8E4|nr:uncharacterized protein C7974DRAFT_8532 [Boeremia exigua]KAH6643878.1 hypothetical protein C7974DRAFT_8532 [Boeremia exigua]
MDDTKLKMSRAEQHPVLPLLPLSSGPPSATQTLIVNYPAARLSTSPASSPNIVEPSIERKGSVHPMLGNSMERGMSPGADFFDDQSSGSEWEDADDEDRTQTFSVDGDVGLGLGSLVHSPVRQQRGSRGRSRERTGLTALPRFEVGHGEGNDLPKRARHVSLTRMEKAHVKVVHNHGSNASTPRGSITSNASRESVTQSTQITKPYPVDLRSGATVLHEGVQNRHRRNTSDSVIADSIINAHLTTMQALNALSPSASIPEISGHSLYSVTGTELPKARSFSDTRHIRLSPISVKDRNNLPSHFVKTPYPFTAKKEFPKPVTRPRCHNLDGRLDSGYGGDSGFGGEGSNDSDIKGKHVLGLMPSGEEYDLRSRLDRNAEAQGVLRTQNTHGDMHCRESVLHLSLQKQSKNISRRRARIIIPSDFSTPGPDRHQNIDFDDTYLAVRLQAAHRELTGSWIKRQFSAKKLRYISLCQSSSWSDFQAMPTQLAGGANRLLAFGAGADKEDATFTEDKLLQLYKHPRTGKARYTWVHWARRVATSHVSPSSGPQTSGASCQDSVDGKEGSVIHHPVSSPADAITTVQFVHTLSTLRVLVALALILATSALAALLWIFFGVGSGWVGDFGLQAANRVGSGMALGVLALLFQSLGFGAWIWLS